MTDNMMPELTLEPTAAAEAVPQLTLEPTAPEVPEPEEKKIEPVEMDEKLLTDEEKKAVEEFSHKIDVRDTNMILQYGAAAQKNVAGFSESALNNVRSKDLGEIGQDLSRLVVELKGFGEDEDVDRVVNESDLLSAKKVIYAANMDEEGFTGNDKENERLKAVQAIADAEGAMVLPICAKLEEDIAGMDAEEKEMFLSELGLHESGLDRLIKVCYDLLGLLSYLTAGEQEDRAWTIEKGTKAPQAAGKIHSDFERGFIRAEVIAFDDLKACGTLANAKAKGLLRSEGKEYIMHDGDVVNFLFNV